MPEHSFWKDDNMADIKTGTRKDRRRERPMKSRIARESPKPRQGWQMDINAAVMGAVVMAQSHRRRGGLTRPTATAKNERITNMLSRTVCSVRKDLQRTTTATAASHPHQKTSHHRRLRTIENCETLSLILSGQPIQEQKKEQFYSKPLLLLLSLCLLRIPPPENFFFLSFFLSFSIFSASLYLSFSSFAFPLLHLFIAIITLVSYVLWTSRPFQKKAKQREEGEREREREKARGKRRKEGGGGGERDFYHPIKNPFERNRKTNHRRKKTLFYFKKNSKKRKGRKKERKKPKENEKVVTISDLKEKKKFF